MSSKKRSYGTGVSGLSAMSTGALMKKARAYEMAKAVRNRAPRIKGAIAPYGGRQELKFVDTAATSYACDTTGTVTALNLIAVGDDNNTRDGRQACIKSVQLHGIVKPVDTTTLACKARILLVWDNAVNSGSIATVSQILTSASSMAFPLIDNAQRFTILMDKSFALGSVSDVATQAIALSPSVHDLEFYKKMNAVTQYSGTTAAIGSIQNGALLLVTVGDIATASAATATISARVRFTDQ